MRITGARSLAPTWAADTAPHDPGRSVLRALDGLLKHTGPADVETRPTLRLSSRADASRGG